MLTDPQVTKKPARRTAAKKGPVRPSDPEKMFDEMFEASASAIRSTIERYAPRI